MNGLPENIDLGKFEQFYSIQSTIRKLSALITMEAKNCYDQEMAIALYRLLIKLLDFYIFISPQNNPEIEQALPEAKSLVDDANTLNTPGVNSLFALLNICYNAMQEYAKIAKYDSFIIRHYVKTSDYNPNFFKVKEAPKNICVETINTTKNTSSIVPNR